MITTVKTAALASILMYSGAAWAQGTARPAAQPQPAATQTRPTPAKTPTASAATPTRSSAADRQSVEVTIYNSDLGLVKERRRIRLPAGEGELLFEDVASAINPVTVFVRPLANAADFSILEQNYEFDLISHAKLMDKYVGKKIKIVDWNEYQDRKTTVEAELLSVNAGEVYKIGNEIYLGHPGTKVLPELPDNLISRPTLSWIYRNRAAREYQLEVSYLTSGMNWSADYILTITDGKPSGLSGWVTVNNMSGAAYENAKLKLVAGDVNRVQPQLLGRARAVREMAMYDMEATQAGGFAQSEVFEYYMYDLQRPTTVKQNQTKQINLLEAQGVTVAREYVTGSTSGISARGSRPGTVKQPVSAFLTFKNTKENKLGNPLPAGIVRIYTADSRGSQQFIGEDRIAHTPKDEEVRLRVGEAFDLVAERANLSHRQISTRISENEISISLRNRKDEDVTIQVVETAFGGNWQITESTHKHTKIDATSFRFDVPVPKGKEVVVRYKVRTGI